MLSVQVDATLGIAVLEPDGALSKEDFERAAKTIDPHLERFVKAHHRKIARIALCTDSALGNVAPRIAKHFVEADIRAFKFAEFERACAWAAGES